MLKDNLILPRNYKPILDVKETEKAIKKIKDYFENNLAKELNLQRVSAPLFVKQTTGLNDNLNGIEEPVSFPVKSMSQETVEIVHSLAKWKRMALYKYNFEVGEGIYTDMNAIRKDEELDNIHSIYVDQWDWEKIIRKEDRTEDTLKTIVKSIYKVFKNTENYVYSLYPDIAKVLPDEIDFITTQELEDMYPYLSPKEREDNIAKEKGAVFIMKIGGLLKSGIKHDGRSPDYDDWNLNGDIIFWNPIIERSFEMSSMGIRVDEETLIKQLKLANCEERKDLEFHKLLIEGKLPYTVGGGIGQSRICMFFLRKAHIGEVQSSVWPNSMIEKCISANIQLL
jgi:aspartate--ammonia ligase